MLGKCFKLLFALTIITSMLAGTAVAGSLLFDPKSGVPMDCPPGYKGVSKVKSGSARPMKVKPYGGFTSGLNSLSGLNPMSWGATCCLPGPAKGQFRLSPTVFFARLTGEAQRGGGLAGLEATPVDFDDQLGLKKSGNAVFSIAATYQFRPRWGLRYSFSPMEMDATTSPQQGFTFGGVTFNQASQIRSKWQRYVHRAGISYSLTRKVSSSAAVFADWMYIQDRLSVADATTGANAVTWDDDKSLAVLGVQFERCLKNYRGNTLALGCKGGIAFLDDSIGYDAEAALSYLIPIKRGRFGFVKGGYRYAHLKKDKDVEMFSTTMDGAFLQVGFIF
jgi:hypothetical protein